MSKKDNAAVVDAPPAVSYAWKAGGHIPGKIKPDVAAAIFEDITERDGALTPPAVLDVARDAGSPLHPGFEWNDEAAAENYRIEQARHLIQCLVVVRPAENGAEPAMTRAYVRILPSRSDEEEGMDAEMVASGRYQPIAVVMEQPPLRDRLLRQARADLVTWQRKYRELQEFAPVFDAISQLPPPPVGTVRQIVSQAQTLRV